VDEEEALKPGVNGYILIYNQAYDTERVRFALSIFKVRIHKDTASWR